MAFPHPQSLSFPLPLFRNPQTHQPWLTFNSFHTIRDHVWLPIYCRRQWEKRGKRDLGGGGGHGRWWEKKKKQSKIFMGLWGLEVRERWFWRKRDGFVGFEREEERFWGEGQPWMMVKRFFFRKIRFWLCVFGFTILFVKCSRDTSGMK